MSTRHAARSFARGLLAALVLCGCASTDPPRRTRPKPVESVVLPQVLTMRPALPVRRVRLRAYADEEFRAHVASWRERIATQVEKASVVTEDEFGVRLEVESIREWRRAGPGELGDVLDLLAREDPGFDVDWVVGFTGPGARPEDGPDLVGRARRFGRHFILRAVESTAPHTLFLHEWAHTLGAVHDCDGNWTMSARHGGWRSAFSPESAWLVRLGLHYRDRHGSVAREEWSSAYRALASHIRAAWPDCEELEADSRYTQWLLFLSSRAYVLGDGALETPWDRWVSQFFHPVSERLSSEAERLKARTALPPHDPTDRIVVVGVSFDATGAVKDVRVLLSSGFAGLDDAVVETFRGYPYPSPPPDLASSDHGFTYSFKLEL